MCAVHHSNNEKCVYRLYMFVCVLCREDIRIMIVLQHQHIDVVEQDSPNGPLRLRAHHTRHTCRNSRTKPKRLTMKICVETVMKCSVGYYIETLICSEHADELISTI